MSEIKIKKTPGSRVPVAEKNNPMTHGKTESSPFDIPEECRKELEATGEEARWIDIVKFKSNHGFHKRGWQPRKFDCLMGKKSIFVTDSGQYEGYLLRSTNILASKSKEEVAHYKNQVKRRTDAQANPGAMKSKEVGDFVRGQGSKALSWDESDDQDS